jgi:serine/threonine protein kinase
LLNFADLRQWRMHPMTEPVEQQARQGANARGAKEWLDALAGGGCDLDAFLYGAGELLQRTPDVGWELLALVDQYYRRGKISAESFGILKSHLQGLLVGKGQRDSLGAPATHSAASNGSAVPLSPAPLIAAVPVAARPAARPSQEVRQEPPRAPEESAPPHRTLAAGDVLRGRYVVQELLGQGGMGTVFAALDQYRVERAQGEQRVALKVLHTDVIKRPRLFTELRREFQHLQSLSHPNIVRVHEFDHDGDLAFFTMEYLSGTMLSRLLTARESSLPRPYALAIIRDVGGAIAHAHSRGVVHGDLNPGNIFITQTGEVRVFDFGASHQLHRGPFVTELDSPDQVAVATPLYASCQVLEGAAATMSDDIYALACVAYLLLAGDHPFQDDNALKARSARLKPAWPRGLSGRQWRALKDGLQFDREQRPSDIQDWLRQFDLHAAAPHLPPLATLSALRASRTSSAGRWMKYAAVTAVIAVGGWWTNQHFDAVVDGAGTIQARVKSWFDVPALSQWLDRRTALGRKPDPVIDYPKGSEETTTTPEATPVPEATKPANEARHEAPAAPPPPRAVAVAPRATAPVVPATASATAAARPAAAVAPAPIKAAPAPSAAAPGAAPAAPAAAYTGPKAHLELAADTVEVSPTDSVAHVIVRRSRTTRGEVSFSWWTESGTALPGRDFTQIETHVETIENGQTTANLSIPVVANPARQVPRNFYVVIDQPSDNATVGPRTLAMISLVGGD